MSSSSVLVAATLAWDSYVVRRDRATAAKSGIAMPLTWARCIIVSKRLRSPVIIDRVFRRLLSNVQRFDQHHIQVTSGRYGRQRRSLSLRPARVLTVSAHKPLL